MTRISKPQERRSISPRKRSGKVYPKTGPKKDQLPAGYKVHANAASNLNGVFIPIIK